MKKLYTLAIFAVLAGVSILFYSFNLKKGNTGLAAVINVDGGRISGVKSTTSDVVSFKGIPFAAPPIGGLRWKAPQPVEHWAGIKKCDAFGPSPMQSKPVPFGVYTKEFLIPEQPISEDCLYLNIWAKNNQNNKKPVFVWIYGGGFTSGGTAVPIYDGEAMAKKGIIFVSVNYRVGVFGFLAHPDLTKESPYKASGNYALLDQIAALNWVKKNIEKFGGDPGNVTIAGQSAGSMSVNCLMASPAAKGLFNKAIAESGSLLISNPMIKSLTLHDAEEQGVRLEAALHVNSIDELRKIPAADLMKAPARYSPVVDGYVLPEPVSQIFAEGKENSVPLLTGWNADEGFVFGFKKKDAFQQEAKEKYGKDAADFLKYYPANTDEEAVHSQTKLSRDLIFAISGYKWADIQSQTKAPVYVYYFQHKLPATPEFEKYGAFHTGEVAYAMDNLKFLNRPWKLADKILAKEISAYWVNFITNGNPNGKNLPAWPKYNKSAARVIAFDNIALEKQLPDKDELEFMLKHVEK
ncbi:carboxylesterase family protein [Mucilaginibacter sp.]|uniref:carboxylesterase/lipase family protein n=1 Tax=Mucilaginibacter sp. TaxID=1882438 RepID=UPI002616C5BB|nr:carboxylesterase family protein [Mucilaginibacter sp.]MDB4920818.1 esterase [Mucilaginibacter sp.]